VLNNQPLGVRWFVSTLQATTESYYFNMFLSYLLGVVRSQLKYYSDYTVMIFHTKICSSIRSCAFFKQEEGVNTFLRMQ
jgi:hypothetical protein